MRISDWSSDVCSFDLDLERAGVLAPDYLSGFGQLHPRILPLPLGLSTDRRHSASPGAPVASAAGDALGRRVFPMQLLVRVDERVDRSEERRVGKECVSPV